MLRWQRVEFVVEQDPRSLHRLVHRGAGSLEVPGIGHPKRLETPNVDGLSCEKTASVGLVKKRGRAVEFGVWDLDGEKTVERKVAVGEICIGLEVGPRFLRRT